MGVVDKGIPIEIAKYLKNKMNLKIAVEGGTFIGSTAMALSKIFSKVYTIENSDQMFIQASRNIFGIENIKLLKGDTRTHLPKILELEDEILFWLDAHWSGGQTYGEKDECPLIDELKIIFKSNKICAILIDDARLFMAPPPIPHDEKFWPSIADISCVIPRNWDLIIFNDVIYITPKSVAFRQYIQNFTSTSWVIWEKKQTPHFTGNTLRLLFNKLIRG